MYLYLNRQNVIIDIVDTLKPVRRVNGLTVLCSKDKAEGYIGCNETVYAKAGTQLIERFEDIETVEQISDIPKYVSPLNYKYEMNTFVENEEPYPLANLQLTENTAQNTANIEYMAMMSGIDI